MVPIVYSRSLVFGILIVRKNTHHQIIRIRVLSCYLHQRNLTLGLWSSLLFEILSTIALHSIHNSYHSIPGELSVTKSLHEGMSNDENSLENVQSNYNGAHDSESTRISNTNGEAERTTTQTYQISHSLEDHTDSDAAHTQHSNSVHTGLDLRYTNTFDVVQEAKRVIQTFLRNNSCYSLIKNSSKVLSISSQRQWTCLICVIGRCLWCQNSH